MGVRSILVLEKNVFLEQLSDHIRFNFASTVCTVSKRVLILRTWSLIRTFLAFWVLIGSLFIFQGPYFHYFGFIHAKNVNSVCMYNNELSYSVCDE